MLALLLGLAAASDHFDGKASTFHPARDLTDLYTWVDRDAEGSKLAMVLAFHPYAGRKARFDRDLTYRFTVRDAEIDGVGARTEVTTASTPTTIDCHLEQTREALICRLEHPGHPGRTRVVRAPIGATAGGAAGGIRIFAGLRHDPFFIDTRHISEPRPRSGTRTRRRKSLDVTDNAIIKARVLAIAIEIDPLILLGGDGLYSVGSEIVWAVYEPDLPRLVGDEP